MTDKEIKKVEESPRLTPEERKKRYEERIERKISFAKERDTRVVRITSPLGLTILNVLRQFDLAYTRFKGQLGESGPRGIPLEQGVKLIEECQEAVQLLDRITRKMNRKVGIRYRRPQELQFMLNQQNIQLDDEEDVEEPATV